MIKVDTANIITIALAGGLGAALFIGVVKLYQSFSGGASQGA